MFAEEKPALGELPRKPFRYYRLGERTVNLDGCIEVEAAYYGAPPGWIGRKVQAQWDELHVRVVAEWRPGRQTRAAEPFVRSRVSRDIPAQSLRPSLPNAYKGGALCGWLGYASEDLLVAVLP
jgi:hypothetical protein